MSPTAEFARQIESAFSSETPEPYPFRSRPRHARLSRPDIYGPGFVYAVYRPDGAVKIGISVCPAIRVQGIQQELKLQGIQGPPKLLYAVRTPSMRRAESSLHAALQSYRIGSSEWFAVPDPLLLQVLSVFSKKATQ